MCVYRKNENETYGGKVTRGGRGMAGEGNIKPNLRRARANGTRAPGPLLNVYITLLTTKSRKPETNELGITVLVCFSLSRRRFVVFWFFLCFGSSYIMGRDEHNVQFEK